jgi:hypothetical protein
MKIYSRSEIPESSDIFLVILVTGLLLLRTSAQKLYVPCLLLLFSAFAFQLWYHAVRTSATVDEPDHILAGYRHLQCGDFGINPEHPPLLKMLVNELPPQGAGEYVPIAGTKPEAFIGGNMLVYQGRFEVPLAAAASHVHRSGAFLRLGQVDNAISEARQAIELWSDGPRPHLALGLALVRAQKLAEALVPLETAASLARDKAVFRNAELRARQELKKLEYNP